MPCSFYKVLFICISGILIFIFCYPNAVLPTTIATAEEGDGVYFDDLMGEYSTSYSSSGSSRKNNIELAAKALNGTKVNAGEKFSFNKTVGIRSAKRGYLPAPVIENGKYVDGVGGGVCQVSTTLYNAALLAGLKVTEYHPHTLAVSYVSPSRDAMVSGTYSDLKFVNTTDCPVYIRVLTGTYYVRCELYGLPDGAEYSLQSVVTGGDGGVVESECYLTSTRGGAATTRLIRKDKYLPEKKYSKAE